MPSTTEIIASVDAVSTGWVAALNPRLSGEYYELTCPACMNDPSRKRAVSGYYYPGSTYINCNRKNTCSGMSIYEYLEGHVYGSLSKQDLRLRIGKDANVDLSDMNATTGPSLRGTVETFICSSLERYSHAKTYLKKRGFDPESQKRLKLGYYPHWQELRDFCVQQGFTEDELIKNSLIPDHDRRTAPFPLNGRVVSVWDMLEPGRFFLWGRAIEDDVLPKYWYPSGINKDKPFGFRKSPFAWFIEGPMDRLAGEVFKFTCFALGGSSVSKGQLEFFIQEEVAGAGFILDAGKAGIDGGRSSVRKCESVGIETKVVIFPEDDDDLASLNQRDIPLRFKTIFSQAINGGVYLAQYLLHQMYQQPGDDWRLKKVANEWSADLTERSKTLFWETLGSYGINKQEPTANPFSLMSNLIKLGVDEQQSLYIVKQRTGVTISAEKEHE